jgi:CRISPR-associated protein Cmr4
MNHLLLGLLAETSIHPGVGRNEGAIDLPVAREGATDYPFVPGSGLKGALRDYCREHAECNEKDWFGPDNAESAGALLMSDARLLLLPVRSLSGVYRWVTCPHLLERLARDMKRIGIPPEFEVPQGPLEERFMGAGPTDPLFLEERSFSHHGEVPKDVKGTLKGLMYHESARGHVKGQLVLLNDRDFAWFARYGLPVQARNVLDENKTSENLWYEEALPSDTLMYGLISNRVRGKGDVTVFKKVLEETPWVQVGGNETTGQGWFAVKIIEAKGG